MDGSAVVFDPHNVDLDTVDAAQITCYLSAQENEYDGRLGLRVAALFIILVTSTAMSLLPVAAARSSSVLRVPLLAYRFARHFGAGVIVATAFIHLLDPAYESIGPASCAGMTGGWAQYSWPPSLAMTSAMGVFLVDYLAHVYVRDKFSEEAAKEHSVRGQGLIARSAAQLQVGPEDANPGVIHGKSQDAERAMASDSAKIATAGSIRSSSSPDASPPATSLAFRQQIAAFLILEFGVIFHSVIIGLNLAVAGSEFNTLFPVIVFHQAFEGLGLGSRLSAIPFPKTLGRVPYLLCAAYGLTTPLAIAAGLGVRMTYEPGSFTANVVSGLFDSVSAGILLYTAFVELLARDFVFCPHGGEERDWKTIAWNLCSLFLGCGIMALLGKWA